MKVIPTRSVIIGSLSLMAGALWFIHRLNEDRESKRLTTLAADYIAKHEYRSASECLTTALALYPENSEARLLLLQIPKTTPSASKNADSTPIPSASPPTVAKPPPTASPSPVVVKTPTPTPSPAPPAAANVDTLLAKAQEFLAAGNPKAAERELRAAMALDPTDKSRSQLVSFLLDQPIATTDTKELVSLLRELGRNQTSIGAEALSTGAVRGLVPRSEIESWLTVLRSHPAATTPMLLTADRLDAMLRPRNQSTIAENAARRLRTAPLADRDAGMRWLASIGEYSLSATLISLDEATRDRATMEAWLANNTLAGNFDAVLTATSAPSLPLPAHNQKLFRGNALAHSGKSAEGLQMMREACEETGTSRAALLDALAILATIHSHPLFEEELSKAVNDPDTTGDLVNSLAPAVHFSGDAVVIRRFYEIAAAAPALRGNDRLSSTRDHFRLVLGLPVDVDELARLSEIARDPAPRIAYIHALLNAGQSAKALHELEDRSPPINPAKLNASQQAVVAATFAASNRVPEAFSVLAQIHQDHLSIQEREWLRGHFDTASKNARAARANTSLTARYPWLASARRIALDLGALLALFLTWKIGKRMHLWLRHKAIG